MPDRGYSPGSYTSIGPYGHRLYKRGAQQEGGERKKYHSYLFSHLGDDRESKSYEGPHLGSHGIVPATVGVFGR